MQADDFKRHVHTIPINPNPFTGGGGGSSGFLLVGTGDGGNTLVEGGPETRPVNTAYQPRIHA